MSKASPQSNLSAGTLSGKKVAVITDAPFSKDYRTQRTVEALVEAGAAVEIVDQGLAHEESQERAQHLGATLKSRAQALSSQGRLVWHVRNRINPAAAYKVRTTETERLLGEIRPDIIHCVNPFDLEACINTKRTLGALLVYEPLEYWPEHIFSENAGFPQVAGERISEIERIADIEVDGFITISQPIDDWYAKRIKTPIRSLIYNANVPPQLSSPPHNRETSPAAPVLRVIHSGNLQNDRNVECAIDATIMRDDIELTILGDGPQKETLLARAAQGIEQGKIIFKDSIPANELIDELATYDVGIALIKPESLQLEGALPNKIFDYLAAGIAVVMTDTKGLRSLPDIEEFCIPVKEMTPQALTDALGLLASNRELLNSLRTASAVHAERYSRNEMKQHVITLYSQLIESQSLILKFKNPTIIKEIGVIMPAYNAADTIERSVKSLQNLGPAIAQIVIVNDGSTDNTSVIAHRLAAGDPRITVVDQENQGASISRNRAFEELATEWMTFLDADDIISPHYIERMDKFIQDHSEFDVFMCSLVRVAPDGYMTAYLESDEPFVATLEEMFKGSKAINIVALMRTKNFAESERFLPRFQVAEDYCLWVSMLAEGKRIIVNPEMLFYYCNSPESLMSNPVRNVIMTRQALLYIEERYKDTLTPAQRTALKAAIAQKTALLQRIAPIESVRKLVEPIGGEVSNRFFRSLFVTAANLRRKIKDRT